MFSHSPDAGLRGGGGCWRDVFWGVAKPRIEDGVCTEWPLRSSKELLARDRGSWPEALRSSFSGGPGVSLFFPGGRGQVGHLPILFSLAPWTGEVGARPHLLAAWGAGGEESWHCSHKTSVM